MRLARRRPPRPMRRAMRWSPIQNAASTITPRPITAPTAQAMCPWTARLCAATGPKASPRSSASSISRSSSTTTPSTRPTSTWWPPTSTPPARPACPSSCASHTRREVPGPTVLRSTMHPRPGR